MRHMKRLKSRYFQKSDSRGVWDRVWGKNLSAALDQSLPAVLSAILDQKLPAFVKNQTVTLFESALPKMIDTCAKRVQADAKEEALVAAAQAGDEIQLEGNLVTAIGRQSLKQKCRSDPAANTAEDLADSEDEAGQETTSTKC